MSATKIKSASVKTKSGPQAVGDTAAGGENQQLWIDVLDNDLAVAAAELWSLDQANPAVHTRPASAILLASGARIWFDQGQVVYDPGRAWDHLGEGEVATDSFSYSIRLGNGVVSYATVTVELLGANDAPIAMTPLLDAQVDEGGALLVALPSGAFADIDRGDTLVLSAALADGSDLPDFILFDGATGSFSIAPGSADSGVYEVRVIATDRSGAAASQAFTLTVNDTATVLSGFVSDGYIAGATVFVDVDGDGQYDAGEEDSTTTDAQGNFSLETEQVGALVAFGGTNIDTGLANLVTLAAPEGSSAINPLTTLVQALVEGGMAAADAETLVKAALGLDPALDLGTYDMLAAPAGDANALAAQKAAVSIVTLLLGAQELAGQIEGADPALAEAAMLDALAAAVTSGGVLDLADPAELGAIFETVFPDVFVGEAVASAAATNQAIAEAEDLAEVAGVQANREPAGLAFDLQLDPFPTAPAAGTIVGQASASDLDGDAITFSLVNDAGGRLAIDPVTGIVTTVDGAIFEEGFSIVFRVRASDGRGGIAEHGERVMVELLNQAPDAPTFVPASDPPLYEGIVAGRVVGQAQAIDPDGDGLSFSLVDDAGGRLAIDAATGIVTVAEGAVFDAAEAVQIIVSVSDGRGGSSQSVAQLAIAGTLTDEDGDGHIIGTEGDDHFVPAGAATHIVADPNYNLGRDVLHLTGSAGDYALSAVDYGSFIRIEDLRYNAPDGVILVRSIDIFDFADGAVALADLGPVHVSGAGADSVYGSEGNDRIFLDGATFAYGGRGTDTLVLGGATMAGYSLESDVASGQVYLVGGTDGGRVSISYIEQVEFDDGILVLASLEPLIWNGADDADDYLGGSSLDDIIYGRGGNDIISSWGGNDVFYGGNGEDLVVIDFWGAAQGVDFTFSGDQTIATIHGEKEIHEFEAAEVYGTHFDDKLTLAAGADNVWGEEGNDVILAGAGEDYVEGGAGDDRIDGGAGDDIVHAGEGHNAIEGGDGFDTLRVDGYSWMFRADYVSEGIFRLTNLYSDAEESHLVSGVEQVEFDEGTVAAGEIARYAGTSGDDQIGGGVGDDLYLASGGTDDIWDNGGVDTLRLTGAYGDYSITAAPDGSGRIVISDTRSGAPDGTISVAAIEHYQFTSGLLSIFDFGPFRIEGTEEGEWIPGTFGNDLIYGFGGDDEFDAQVGGSDFIDGGDGSDWIWVSFGDEAAGITFTFNPDGELRVGSAAHQLRSVERVEITGSRFDDVLTGAAGDDWINGTSGQDVIDGAGGIDTYSLRFGVADLSFDTSGTDGVRVLAEGAIVVTLRNVEQLQTGDGTFDLAALLNPLLGTAGDDLLQGTAGSDVAFAGAGDDRIELGAGNDYVDGGDGIDTAQVDFSSFSSYLYFGPPEDGVPFHLGDKTLVSIEALDLTATQFDDYLFMGDRDDSVVAGDGDDQIDGGLGDDELDGGDGSDRLSDGGGFNVVRGGAGADTLVLEGWRGSFVVERVDPLTTRFTTIDGASSWTVSGVELVQFYDAIVPIAAFFGITGTAGDDYIFGTAGDDDFVASGGLDTIDAIPNGLKQGLDTLHLSGSRGEYAIGTAENGYQLRIEDQRFGSPDGIIFLHGIDVFNFADGALGLAELGPILVEGRPGPDWVYGTYGDDRIVLNGAGGVYGGRGLDTVVVPGAAADYRIGHDPISYVYLEKLADGTRVTLAEVDRLEFDDSMLVLADLAPLEWYGTDEGEFVSGSWLNDIVYAGGGDDDVDGTYGGNDILYGGDGIDRVNLDFWGPNAINFVFSGTGTVQTASGLKQLHDFEAVEVYGSWAGDSIVSGAGEDRLYAEHGDDNVSAGDGDDYVEGGEGNDVVDGGAGDDTVEDGEGDDRLSGGAGDDWIADWLGNNVADGGDGVDTFHIYGERSNYRADYVDAGTIRITDIWGGTGATFLLTNFEWIEWDNEAIAAGDLVVHAGTPDDDYYYGHEGDEQFIASGGSDVIWAGEGTDILRLTGDRSDYAFSVGADSSYLFLTDTRPGSPDGTIALEGIEIFDFADIDLAVTELPRMTLAGSEDADTIWGTYVDDLILGFGGDDYLSLASGGSDILDGGDGTDSVDIEFWDAIAGVNFTFTGNQLLTEGGYDDQLISIETVSFRGSGFADVLTGGSGDDSFFYSRGSDILDGGDGYDFVHVDLPVGAVTFQSIDAQTVTFQINPEYADWGYDTSAVITLRNIESVGLGGHSFDPQALARIVIGTEDVDHLGGTEQDDVLLGLGGDDRFDLSGAGSDYAEGGDGIDTLILDLSAAETSVSLGLPGAPYEPLLVGSKIAYSMERLEVRGSAHGDWLQGGAYGDVLQGGDGADSIHGGGGNDRLDGEGGDDFVRGGSGDDVLAGGDGDDVIADFGGHNVIDGGNGFDRLSLPNDRIRYGFGYVDADSLTLRDRLTGESWALDGIEQVDFADMSVSTLDLVAIRGTDAATEQLSGDNGDNLFLASAGITAIWGAGGVDTLRLTGSISDYRIEPTDAGQGYIAVIDLRPGAPDGTHNVHSIERFEFADGVLLADQLGPFSIIGTDASEVFQGTYANDEILGSGGDDSFNGSVGGTDFYHGGEGIDRVYFSFDQIGVDFTFTGNQVVQLADRLLFIEAIEAVSMFTSPGDDRIVTGAGDDTFVISRGQDSIDAGAGTDQVSIGFALEEVDFEIVDSDTVRVSILAPWYGGATTLLTNVEFVQIGNIIVNPRAMADPFMGTAGDDQLGGSAADDAVFGLDGNDSLSGGNLGNDYLHGGEGIDRVSLVYFDATAPVQMVFYGNQTLETPMGTKTLMRIESVSVHGSTFDDVLIGGDYDDVLVGMEGGDYLDGLAGDDLIDAGVGDDRLFGGYGVDRLSGGPGDDVIWSGPGSDHILLMGSDSGNDILADFWSGSEDKVYARNVTVGAWAAVDTDGDGFADSMRAAYYNSVNPSTNGTLTVTGLAAPQVFNWVPGTENNDYLIGSAGNDHLYGLGGDDIFNTLGGNDYLDGGDGSDRVYVSLLDAANGLNFNLQTDRYLVLGNGSKELESIEAIEMIGSPFDDIVTGGSGNDALQGRHGNDILSGGGGHDVLTGEWGDDILTGGAGIDTFWLLDYFDGDKTITDFTRADDQIVANHAVTLSPWTFEDVNGDGALDAVASYQSSATGGGGGDLILLGIGTPELLPTVVWFN